MVQVYPTCESGSVQLALVSAPTHQVWTHAGCIYHSDVFLCNTFYSFSFFLAHLTTNFCKTYTTPRLHFITHHSPLTVCRRTLNSTLLHGSLSTTCVSFRKNTTRYTTHVFIRHSVSSLRTFAISNLCKPRLASLHSNRATLPRGSPPRPATHRP